MKTFIPLLLFSLFLSSCTWGPFAPAATQTPAPTQTDTATPAPTATPVLPTQTFTLTPTLVGIKTFTPTPENTATPEVTNTPFVIPTLADTPTLSIPKMEGFASVSISSNEIYKALGCEPSRVHITAQVDNSSQVEYVLLFARFKSLKAERVAKWSTFQMDPIGAGTYVFDLSSDQMREDAYFTTSWIEYQIVSTTRSGREVGRTDIFKERLKMLECKIEPTATSANVKP